MLLAPSGQGLLLNIVQHPGQPPKAITPNIDRAEQAISCSPPHYHMAIIELFLQHFISGAPVWLRRLNVCLVPDS